MAENIENNDIPEGVNIPEGYQLPEGCVIADPIVFNELMDVKQNPILKDPILHFSDRELEPIHPQKVVVRGWDWFEEYIAHLPPEEKDELRQRLKDYKVLKNKEITLSRSAFHKQGYVYFEDSNEYHFLQSKVTELVELFGQFYTDGEVLKYVKSQWGVSVTLTNLVKWRRTQERAIAKRKEEYKNEWKSLRLANKRAWLEELQELYLDRKNIYYTEGKNRLDYIQLLNTLKLVRDVVVDAGQKIDVHIDGKVEVAINHTIGEEILKSLPVIEIIVGRVAAQMKVPPHKILERLHSSIYSKFSGIGTQSIEDLDDTPVYPSQMVYDWKAIEKLHKEQPIADIEVLDVTEAEIEKGKRLLEIIHKKVGENKSFLGLVNSTVNNTLKNQ